MAKKKVVYLLGSGATHAVLMEAKFSKGMLTNDIRDVIESKYSRSGIDVTVWNELITEDNDIEHLISVLEAQHNYSASQKVRTYYRNAIIELAEEFSKRPPAMSLYDVLFDLHTGVKAFPEQLLCFMTLNYEDILERCLEKHFDCTADYVVQTVKGPSRSNRIGVLKLHGSFNWTNERPIAVEAMTAIKDQKTLWIPPGTEKKRENYPFNLLWGKAMECLMECDVLRVIGCSLSRNDWGLIPILYTVQKFSKRPKGMEVEIIDFADTGDQVQRNYRYLTVKKITQIDDVISLYGRQFPKAPPHECRLSTLLTPCAQIDLTPFCVQ